jgi:ribosomal protein L11 methyltransferase
MAERLLIFPASKPITGNFSLITANLRFPDIMNLFPMISAHAEPGAPVVLSGIRPDELPAILARYTDKQFQCIKTSEEKNWSCIVLQRNPFPAPAL